MKSQFKKSISIICTLLLIISVLSLAACGKDSDSIVGTWETTLGDRLPFAQRVTSIIFYRDGSFIVETGDYLWGDLHVSGETYSGTYSTIYDGTAVELVLRSGSTHVLNYDLSDHRLILSGKDTSIILTRVD